jgi:hypothetical protein
MSRALALLLLLTGSAALADTTADAVSLEVKPLLCIVDRRTPACDMSFRVAWQSFAPGSYCLFNHFETAPLRCWTEALSGQLEERRVVDKGFSYWLTAHGSDQPVAAVAVEVMTTDTSDRRRQRRSRHVWDIL